MIKRLIKTLYLERGKLYVILEGRRILLASCEPRIEIFEHSTNVPILGKQGGSVKKHHITVVICGNLDFTREINEEFLQSVTSFELTADIQREDGIFENIVFDKLDVSEIDLDGDWTFEIEGQTNLTRKLLDF